MGIKQDVKLEMSALHYENLMTLSVRINDEKVEVKVPPTLSLAVILRNYFQLTGTKIACGIGRCGACSILLDDELVNACLVMAYQANGKSITTIEGLSKLSLDEVQEAFLKQGGYQCGYCTPGMIMAVKAMFDRNPHPQESDIEEALAGNLCRCTGYGGILRAVKYVMNQKHY
ncbi:(2Fe-2S)-binding protein [Ureibacillus thermophilus]|uniref:(2Fe-2S)-binding protein n=2 Tax=Ureibacillus thermophilus TaxID=367743 RepID=A0A4V1A354_9BACL|nr:(2Fe-2S)-binding protein [Ureibacillus thermophilus]